MWANNIKAKVILTTNTIIWLSRLLLRLSRGCLEATGDRWKQMHTKGSERKWIIERCCILISYTLHVERHTLIDIWAVLLACFLALRAFRRSSPSATGRKSYPCLRRENHSREIIERRQRTITIEGKEKREETRREGDGRSAVLRYVSAGIHEHLENYPIRMMSTGFQASILIVLWSVSRGK